MSSVYSQPLLNLSLGPGVSGPFAPPTGYAWVIVDMDMYSNVSGFTDITAHVRDSVSLCTFWFWNKAATDPDGRTWQHWDGRQVFTDTGFEVDIGGVDDVDVRISGYQLELP
jgi:hypothetical protein